MKCVLITPGTHWGWRFSGPGRKVLIDLSLLETPVTTSVPCRLCWHTQLSILSTLSLCWAWCSYHNTSTQDERAQQGLTKLQGPAMAKRGFPAAYTLLVRLQEDKGMHQSHMASGWWRRNVSPGSLTPESYRIPRKPMGQRFLIALLVSWATQGRAGQGRAEAAAKHTASRALGDHVWGAPQNHHPPSLTSLAAGGKLHWHYRGAASGPLPEEGSST